jgi:hypothetical protein
VAQACRLGLEAPGLGAEHCIIAAADTVMRRPNRELIAECFPQLSLTHAVGDHESLQSSVHAHRLMGYQPRFSWRTQV